MRRCQLDAPSHCRGVPTSARSATFARSTWSTRSPLRRDPQAAPLAGLAKVGTIALDGTKVKANARGKAMSDDRMKTGDPAQGRDRRALADAEAARRRKTASMAPTAEATSCPPTGSSARAGRQIQQAKKICWRKRARIEATEEAACRQAEGETAAPDTPSRPFPTQGSDQTPPRSRVTDHEGLEQGGGTSGNSRGRQRMSIRSSWPPT